MKLGVPTPWQRRNNSIFIMGLSTAFHWARLWPALAFLLFIADPVSGLDKETAMHVPT